MSLWQSKWSPRVLHLSFHYAPAYLGPLSCETATVNPTRPPIPRLEPPNLLGSGRVCVCHAKHAAHDEMGTRPSFSRIEREFPCPQLNFCIPFNTICFIISCGESWPHSLHVTSCLFWLITKPFLVFVSNLDLLCFRVNRIQLFSSSFFSGPSVSRGSGTVHVLIHFAILLQEQLIISITRLHTHAGDMYVYIVHFAPAGSV